MPKPSIGQRREKKVVGENLYLRCYGTFHDGEWLPWQSFGKHAKGYYTLCRECRNYYQAKLRKCDSTVKLELVRKWLWEVINRCGSANEAARVMGVSNASIYRWLGRYRGYNNKRIKREKVKLILETLAGLRAGTIKPTKRHNGGKVYKYGCRGCGCDLNEYTPGCGTCDNRRRGKERWKDEKYRNTQNTRRKEKMKKQKLEAA